MTEDMLHLEFAKQVVDNMKDFESWYSENIHGFDDMWMFNAKAVVEFEKIGDLYHELENDLKKMKE